MECHQFFRLTQTSLEWITSLVFVTVASVCTSFAECAGWTSWNGRRCIVVYLIGNFLFLAQNADWNYSNFSAVEHVLFSHMNPSQPSRHSQTPVLMLHVALFAHSHFSWHTGPQVPAPQPAAQKPTETPGQWKRVEINSMKIMRDSKVQFQPFPHRQAVDDKNGVLSGKIQSAFTFLQKWQHE